MGFQLLDRTALFPLQKKKLLLGAVASLIVLLPALVLLVQITKQAVDTPYQDQWELVPLIQSVDNGTFSPVDLWHLHNQHRLFFPKLIMLASAYLTHWNVGAEMIISWCLAVTCFIVLLLLMRRIKVFQKHTWMLFLASLSTATMVFSFNQLENWLWGWQLQWYLCDLGVLLAIFFLTSHESLRKRNLIAAILAGVLATYSLASGQLIWPIGLLILWILHKPVKAWLIAAAVVLASYYYSYHPAGYQTPPDYLLRHPLSLAKYFFSYVGRPLTENAHYTVILGILGVIIAAVTLGLHLYTSKNTNTRKSLTVIIIPLSLLAFALCNGVITTMSRSGIGFLQSLSSRYISISMFFWIGLTWLIVVVISEHRKKLPHTDLIISTILCLILGVALTASIASTKPFAADTTARRAIKACSTQDAPSDACLMLTYPAPEVVRPRIMYLKEKHWAGF